MDVEEKDIQPIIAFGLNNIGCDQKGATFQTILPEKKDEVLTGAAGDGAHGGGTEVREEAEEEELCHFVYPGLGEREAWAVHRQIKDLVRRFPMKDICTFLSKLAEEKKILLPQIPKNAIEELQRMGMPSTAAKGFGYDNFCKYYRK